MMLYPWRQLIIGTETPILTSKGYVKRVYFDNTATTLVAKPIRDKWLKILKYYCYNTEDNELSKKISDEYNNVANIILDFISADKAKDTAIYTKSATEAANVLANAFYQQDPEQIILATRMNHAANYLSYKARMKVVLVNVTKNGDVDMEDYKNKLIKYKGLIKNVVVTGTSNLTGIEVKYYDMARLAHKYGARITVDIVQMVQHQPFVMNPKNIDERIDFTFFSSHKIYAGQSGGALIGPKDFLNKYCPLLFGNEIFSFLDDKQVIYEGSPVRYQAGYPDMLGIISMGESLKLLKSIGMNNIAKYEKSLYDYAISGLKDVKGITIYAYNNPNVKAPIISFNLKGLNYKELSQILGYEYGIALAHGRAGADIYAQFLLGLSNKEAYSLYKSGVGYGVVRISMGIFNTFEEIDRFIFAMNEISKKYS